MSARNWNVCVAPGAITTESIAASDLSWRPHNLIRVDSVLRRVMRISVPAGTRIIGPGGRGGPPGSANAAMRIEGPVFPSGYHSASRASRFSVNTPLDNRPAETRLSLAIAAAAAVLFGCDGAGVARDVS